MNPNVCGAIECREEGELVTSTLGAFIEQGDPAESRLNDETRVVARCHDCDDEHRVGDREPGWTTTVCPECASTSYGTEVLDK